MISKQPTGQCRLHNVQFYNLLPRAIVCSAINSSQTKLAIARDDGTIEIWNLSHAPFLEKTITGGDGVSVEGLAWAGTGRLFSVSLAGSLIEWDLSPGDHPRVKQTLLVTGNAAWCVDVSRDWRLLAVGTEGGYINVYRLDNDELTYERILDKQEGRIVCCRFDWTGDFLVTGSADAVRVWDVRNGHAVHKMTTGRQDRKQETTVWAVSVLKDFTIVSVDSRGRMMLFDGHLGTVLETMVVSKADLLCLEVDVEENKVYVAGVEPIIRIYSRLSREAGAPTRFIRSAYRRVHTHDIKTLASFGNKSIISGGLDGTLVITTFSSHLRVDKYLPLLQSPAAVVATKSRTVLLKYINYLEVWTLAPSANSAGLQSNGGNKILQIRSKNDEHILCATISPNGRWIVYSNETTIRLLRYDHNPTEPAKSRLQRVRNLPEQFGVSYRVDFTHDSNGFFLYARNGTINYFACTTGDEFFDHKQSIEGSRWLSEVIHLSAVSQCGHYLVCADVASAIVVFERSKTANQNKTGKWKRSISLPRYRLPPTALAIQPGRTRLAVAFADHKLFVYDFDEFQFLFSTYVQLDGPDWGSPGHPIGGIVFDPRYDSSLILQNESYILSVRFGEMATVEREEEAQQADHSKRLKSGEQRGAESANEGNQSKYTLKAVRKGARLVSISWLEEDELVAIEANALSLVEHLPAAFRKKAYAKM
ncbi:U3 small nucleolar RNA-associated protein 4 homolog [Anopheles ziemanni]|uniref:U3 small nucleolar RNA-associated protein 4 homolog n=1 Tax=Anopheles coustani TaxID=139045 RepID=UPI00265AAE76|nr:U3 small nucleolar RNA-associated protein 4 homolog [Anopheles coustani]XP_058168689.1 U3 small nucleolar RNA-associated protein 4 homolog [Anopheles ziemanni]